ncbi:MAG: hypothetical protein JXR37_13840 [Kiritimatiellae bacterium]|nr:hypothetical protein [Kiritimatiellia bacterium]
MKKKNTDRLPVAVGIGLGLLLVAGVVQLFLLRFAAGDLYPPYSSRRADPLGTQVFYHSLDASGRVRVARNYDPWPQWQFEPQSVCLFLGVAPAWAGSLGLLSPGLPRDAAGYLQRFMSKGGRIVVTYLPAQARKDLEAWNFDDSDSDDSGESERKPRSKHPAAEPDGDREEAVEDETEPKPGRVARAARDAVRLQEFWNFDFRADPLPAGATAGLEPGYAGVGLPESVVCHSSLTFTDLPADWQTVYARDGCPVVIERRIGQGSLVLSTLSYFVSNEALKSKRYPNLLVWLLGGRTAAVFDEYHHGLSEAKGTAAAIRRYRLHAFAIGLLLLAGLFVWRQSVSLVPAAEARTATLAGAAAEGKGAASGLINLLRRNVTTDRILDVCLAEWEKACGRLSRELEARAARMRAVAEQEKARPRREKDPVRAYNDMQRILKEKRHYAAGRPS